MPWYLIILWSTYALLWIALATSIVMGIVTEKLKIFFKFDPPNNLVSINKNRDKGA